MANIPGHTLTLSLSLSLSPPICSFCSHLCSLPLPCPSEHCPGFHQFESSVPQLSVLIKIHYFLSGGLKFSLMYQTPVLYYSRCFSIPSPLNSDSAPPPVSILGDHPFPRITIDPPTYIPLSYRFRYNFFSLSLCFWWGLVYSFFQSTCINRQQRPL